MKYLAAPIVGVVSRTWDAKQRLAAQAPRPISDDERLRTRAHELLAENAKLEAEERQRREQDAAKAAAKRANLKAELVKARIDIVRRHCTAAEFAQICEMVEDPDMQWAKDGSGHEGALKWLRNS